MLKSLFKSRRPNADIGHATKTGDFWDSRVISSPPARSSWYIEPFTIRHINRIVCGEEIDGLHAGFHKRLAEICFTSRTTRALFPLDVGTKEMDALKLGIVHHFDCFELGAEAINKGIDIARSNGLSDRITFHQVDPFTQETEDQHFDLVYWNNALHHMFDAAGMSC